MQQRGIRRLLVISGETDWCRYQARMLSGQLAGDWLWVGKTAPQKAHTVLPGALKKWLGQEILHGIFDALSGLDIEALAILTGMLRAGSWLLLLVPPWSDWPFMPDEDSLRWSGQPEPVMAPNFIGYFQQQLSADPDVVLWHQGDSLVIPKGHAHSCWQPANGQPGLQQQAILAKLMAAKKGVWTVTAARGRGKSALAGMLIDRWPGLCWVTGPAAAATDVLSQWSGKRMFFWAPDALLAHCRVQDTSKVDWLLIDEAAAIPAPLLQALISYFPRVLLTTTVQGYEGTGRGFLLKFCASLPNWYGFTLTEPVRWAAQDPLELLLDRTLLWVDEVTEPLSSIPVKIICCHQADWLLFPQRLAQFYGLLIHAHYRTSPLDLRRLLDAPGMHCTALMRGVSVVGALWAVEEGGLDMALAHDIWAGRRRPRGSMVAQSLAAHAGLWLAPTFLSWRISRVAIMASLRRQGWARQMIFVQRQQAQQQGIDFLSVSFGYTEALWCFWQACGFELLHLGTQREASSGCYAAMAVLPLSIRSRALCQVAQRKLARDWHWLKQHIPVSLPIRENNDVTLTEDDWRELAGFAFALRPPEASFAALQRLLVHSILPLTVLRQHLSYPGLQKGLSQATLPATWLTGRKALIRQWRNEAGQAMMALDKTRCLRWQQWAAAAKTDSLTHNGSRNSS